MLERPSADQTRTGSFGIMSPACYRYTTARFQVITPRDETSLNPLEVTVNRSYLPESGVNRLKTRGIRSALENLVKAPALHRAVLPPLGMPPHAERFPAPGAEQEARPSSAFPAQRLPRMGLRPPAEHAAALTGGIWAVTHGVQPRKCLVRSIPAKSGQKV
jgi:hypothetical protein